MFLNDIIQRRLATLLQPWLRGDQELELKLGFLRSNGTINHISFNTSALNELLDDPSKFCFKEATVEHLSLQFSPFSSAAFTLVVRGLRVVLSLGEEEDEGGGKWRRKPRDTTVEERIKVLEDIDPENKCARPGRQLWNIVATRISSLLPTSNLSLIKVVETAGLWLRYIKTYQSILLLIGYPADEIMKRSASLMFRDTTYSRSVRSQWNLIAEIENDLPLGAIAVARRIIRHRVAARDPVENRNHGELLATGLLSKLLQLLVLILSMIGSLLVSFMRILFLYNLIIVPESSSDFGSVRENSVLQQSITLKIQEISVSVSPDNDVQHSISGKAFSGTKISLQRLQTFNFSIDAFFLRYMANISEKCLTFASGCLKVFSSTSKAGASSYSEEHRKKEVDNRQIVAWGEPAQIIDVSEATSDNDRTSDPHLGRLLGKMWLNWKDYCLKPEGENLPNVQAPWILGDIWSCLIDRGISDSSSRVNCGLVVGKLNFNLGYYSFASTVVLIRQIQCALFWSPRRKNVVLHAPAITIEDPPVRYCGKITSFFSQIEMGIIRMLPEKHVQIGVLVAGPHIVISLLNDQFNLHHRVTRLSFDFCNIELRVSPNLDDKVGLSGENTSVCDRGPEYLGLKEPQETGISRLDNGAYSCQGQISLNAYLKVNGLKAYVGGTTDILKHEIIVLRPTTTIILEVLHESLAFTIDGSGGNQSYEEVSSRETVYSESECGRTFVVTSKHSSLATKPQVFVNTTCELKSFDMVLHYSRKSCSQETYLSMMPNERETGRKSTMHDTSSNGIYISIQQLVMEFMFNGRNLDVVIDTTGVRCIIFKYLTEFDGISHKSELKNLLRSLSFLTEASVYHSKLCFCLINLEKALPSASLHSSADEFCFHGVTFHTWDDSPLIASTERPGDHWLFTNIVVSGIYMAGCQVKDILVNQLEEFNASFSVGGRNAGNIL
ncbi:hypothetical protein DH2020_037201 [Rehmannia glutinosa]|uniref:Uncharacterized protein n=1 Tax=Rehmannia glutinosa TaxID=99300 RepID=A0ABR0V4T9_REHGL